MIKSPYKETPFCYRSVLMPSDRSYLKVFYSEQLSNSILVNMQVSTGRGYLADVQTELNVNNYFMGTVGTVLSNDYDVRSKGERLNYCKHGYPGCKDLYVLGYRQPIKEGCYKCLIRDFMPRLKHQCRMLEENAYCHYKRVYYEWSRYVTLQDDWQSPAPEFLDVAIRELPGSTLAIKDYEYWEEGFARDAYTGKLYLTAPIAYLPLFALRKTEQMLREAQNREFKIWLADAITLGHPISDFLASDHYFDGFLDRYRPECVIKAIRDKIHGLKPKFMADRRIRKRGQDDSRIIKNTLAELGETEEYTRIYNEGLFECTKKDIWKQPLKCSFHDCPFEKQQRKRRYCAMHHWLLKGKSENPAGQIQSAMDTVADTFKRAFAKTTIKHEHEVPGIDRLIEEIGTLKSSLGRVLREAQDSPTNEMKVPWVKMLVSTLVLISQLYRQWRDWPSMALAVTQYIMTFDLNAAVKAQILDMIKDLMAQLFRDQPKISTEEPSGEAHVGPSGQAQDLNSDLNEENKILTMLKVLGPLAAVVTIGLIIYKVPAKESFAGFMRDYSKAGACISSTETIWDRASRMTDVVFTYVAGETQGFDGSSSWDSVREWVNQVRSIMNSKLHEDMRHNDVLREKVDSLIISGNSVLQFLDNMKVPISQRTHVQQCMVFLHQRAYEIASSSHGGVTSPRVPPIIVHFFGDSGCGKTTTLNAIVARYLTGVGCTDPKDMETKVFYKNPSKDGRWDGYNSKVIMAICDDTRILKDTIQNPNPEITDTIRMGNTANYLLEMPHLHDKGTTSFRATCVIWTSNRSSYKMESITNPEAVLRRITLKYRQKPHPDVAMTEQIEGRDVTRLDEIKVQQAIRRGKTMRDLVLFDRVEIDNSADPKVVEGDLTFDEMMDQVMAADQFNKTSFRSIIASNAEYWNQCVNSAESPGHTTTTINYNDLSGIHARICEFDLLHDRYQLWQLRTDVVQEKARMARINRLAKGMSLFKLNLKRKVAIYDLSGSLLDALLGDTGDLDLEQKTDNSIAGLISAAFVNSISGGGNLNDLPLPVQPTTGDINPSGVIEVADADEDPWGKPEDYEFPMITYFDTSWNPFRQPDSHRRHLNIRESLRFYEPPVIGEVMQGPEYNYGDDWAPLCDAHCVVIDEKKVPLFLRGFAAAKAQNTALGSHFDDIFYTVSGLGAAHFQPCDCLTHKSTEDDNSFSNRMTRGWAKGYSKGRLSALASAVDAARHKNAFAWYIITGLQIGINLLLLYLGYRFVKWAVVGTADALVTATKKVTQKVLHSVKQMGYYVKGKFVAYDSQPEDDTNWAAQYDTYPRGMLEAARVYVGCGSGELSVSEKKQCVVILRQISAISSLVEEDDRRHAAEQWKLDYNRLRECFPMGGPAEAYGVGQPMARPVGQVELSQDQNAQEMGPFIYRNLYRMEYFDAQINEWRHAMNLLILKGRIGLVNKHLMVKSRFTKWRIVNCQNPLGYEMNIWKQRRSSFPQNSSKYFDVDAMLIELPNHVPQHQDITGKFMTTEDFSRFTSLNQVALITYSANDLSPRQLFTSEIRADDRTFDLKAGVTKLGSIRRYFEYAIPTMGGYCGGVLCAYDNAFNRKLIGIHSAGQTGVKYTGVGQPIHQGHIRELLDGLKLVAPDSELAPDVSKIIDKDITIALEVEAGEEIAHLVCRDDTLKGTTPYGTVNMAPHRSYNTKIRKSPIYGVISTPKTKPAMLRPMVIDGEKVDPMRKAQMKATVVAPPPDENLTNAAVNHYRQIVCSGINPDDQKVRSIEESIGGIPGNKYYVGMNRSSSAGYGWTATAGKRKLLGYDEYICDHPEVVKRHAVMLALCKSGVRPSSVCIDTLKDERRPIEKVNQGKTRLFSAGEMIYTIVFRQYFMGFIAHMMKNRIDFESCVGVNVFNADWTRIAHRITRYGDRVVAGDFTNYDGTLNATFLWKILDIIECYYCGTEEDKLVRRCLWSDIVNSIHLSGNSLYGWDHSNPSGCAITTILNSVYHSIAARYVYLWCARNYAPMYFDLRLYDMNVSHVNYGDDDIYGLSAEVYQWFNQLTMSEAFATIGMTYTDEVKTIDLVPYRSLSDIQFLKRKFRWDPVQMRYRAPLSLDTIREMAQWVRGDVDHWEITAVTLMDAVHELAQHSAETFEEEIPAFERAREIIAQKIMIAFHTYQHYQEIEYLRWVEPLYYRVAPYDIPNPEKIIVPRLASFSGKRVDVNRGDVMGLDAELCDPEIDQLVRNFPIILEYAQPPAGQVQIGDFVAHVADRITGGGTAFRDARSSTITSSEVAKDSEKKTVGGGGGGTEDAVDEAKETVLFREDAPVAMDDPGPSNEVLDYIEVVDDSLKNDVVGFLQRPFITGRFTWTSAMAQKDQLLNLDLPRRWLGNAMIQDKLRGFRYLRCDFEIRVQCNAQPFNAGVLIISINPLAQMNDQVPSMMTHMGGLTGLRHVCLDLSESTSAELHVPYVLPQPYFVLDQHTPLCHVGIYIYSPLTGTGDVDGTVWINATNIRVEMPMYSTVSPGNDNPSGQAQVGGTRATEERVAGKGTVQKLAESTSRVAGVLTGVPELGAVAGVVSWAANAVAGVAAYFGWSKPSDITMTSSVQLTQIKGYCNFNGDTKDKCLGIDAENAIRIMPGLMGSDKDEMSLAYILSRPIYLRSFRFSTSDTPGTVLNTIRVHPNNCTIGSSASLELRPYQNTYLSYLSQMFRYWRGSLVFHFRIVKTAFHSGRIRITYNQGSNVNPAANVQYCYQQVIDIRERTSFVIEVPYAVAMLWSETARVTEDGRPYLFIEVLNPLRCPPSVSDTIEFLVEISGGDDFQFAVPYINDDFRVYLGSYVPLALAENATDPPPSGQVQVADDQLDEITPMFENRGMQGVTPNTLAIGEVVTSLRQVLKRYQDISPATYRINAGSSIRISPYNPDSLRNASNNYYPTFYLWTAMLYRFMTGSMKIMLFPYEGYNNTTKIRVSWAGGVYDLNGGTALGNWSKPYQMFSPYFETMPEFRLPWYSQMPFTLTGVGKPHLTPSPYTHNNYAAAPFPLALEVAPTGGINLEVHRMIGEDFNFGYILGPPITYGPLVD